MTLAETLYDGEVCTRLADEIDIACNDLRMKGLNLKNIKVVEKSRYSKWELEWMDEFREACSRLKASGKNLNIPITMGTDVREK